MFMRAPWLWVGMALVLVLVFLVVGLVPLLGTIATSLGLPLLAGGWMLAADRQQRGEAAEVGDLFAPFRRHELLTPLLVQGAVVAVVSLAVIAMAAVLGAGAVLGVVGSGSGRHGAGGAMVAAGAGLVAVLLITLIGLLAAAALWFAPALVVFRGTPPIDALRLSLAGVAKNVLPFLVYGVIQIVLAIVAAVPFGLGWVVLLPVMLLTAYTSYRDVFPAADG